VRIAIIAHLKHAIREPYAGGLEMHTHLLATALRSRGHDITVFASTRSEPALGLEAICDETALRTVGVAEAPDVAFFKEHHAYLTLMNALRHRNFDIVHNNSLHYLPVAMADALPMPVVTTLHTPPFCWLESGIRVCRSPHASFVAVSESVRRAWSPITAIDRVVLNGIDLSRFAYQAEPDAEPYFVWYGRIVPEKGLHLAIDAARRIGVQLRFSGPISDDEYFAEEIAPRLSSDVVYLGHLAHTALATVIGGARVFLCTPRWEEPYGLVVAEALACGVPVAAFRRGAIPEIVDPSCGVMATPDDVDALAVAAIAAQKLNRLDCRRRAELLCDARRMISGYENLYQELVDRAVRPKPAGQRVARPARPLSPVKSKSSRPIANPEPSLS
jgi:glycosyltransferase involved in cell wall biosynthesis